VFFTIYRIRFPVLRQNENDAWYDRKSRIVFTCSKGLPGVDFSRAEWNEIKEMKSGTVSRTIMDDTLPGSAPSPTPPLSIAVTAKPTTPPPGQPLRKGG
jgi:hypothetical protein